MRLITGLYAMAAMGMNTELYSTSVMLDDLYNVSIAFYDMLNDMTGMPTISDGELRDSVEEWLLTAEAADEFKDTVSDKDLKNVLATGRALQMQVMFAQTESAAVESGDVDFDYIQIAARGAPGSDNRVRGDERFINYGCYCTPSESHFNSEHWYGTGEPVDEIDSVCRNLFFGYQCLKNDHGQMCDSARSYEWKVGDNGQPTCADPVGSCKGDLCRLDLDFTAELYKVKSMWKGRFHANNGFDRAETCHVGHVKLESSSETVANDDAERTVKKQSMSVQKKIECCGTGFGRHIYHIERHECCIDGTSKPIGTC